MYREREREREVKLFVVTAYEREEDEQKVVTSVTPFCIPLSDNHIVRCLWAPVVFPAQGFPR